MLELWIGLLVGILLGCVLGFFIGAWCSVYNDKMAVEQGVIKLCGRIFRLEEIQ